MIRFLRGAWEECKLELLILAVIAGLIAFSLRDFHARADAIIRNDINQPSGVIVGDPDDLVRFVDAEAGVVCYTHSASWDTLECLPIGETRLGP